VQKTDSNGTVKFLWDGDSIVLEANASNSPQVVYTVKPVRFGSLVSQNRNGTESFYHFDALDAARNLSDITGAITDTYEYDAWGVPQVTTGATTNSFLFSARTQCYSTINSVTYLLRARYYDSSSGRFLTTDPLYPNSDSSNLYEYARSNPLAFRDPAGLAVMQAVCTKDKPIMNGVTTVTQTNYVVMPPATAATACPKGYMLESLKPLQGDEAKMAGLCAAMALACPGCTIVDCERMMGQILSVIHATQVTIFWWDHCQRWGFEFERLLDSNQMGGLLGNPCVKSGGLYRVPFNAYGGATSGHVYYQITFCDGTSVYIDNGGFSGGDHIWFQGDKTVPIDAVVP
jgi:RHS repeat-associated protein